MLLSRALLPQLSVTGVLFACAPLIVFFGPLLPFTRWLGRKGAFAAAVLVAAAARTALALPPFAVRLFASALVVGACVLFLSLAVGYIERRSIAAGAALAVCADQVLRLFGWSYDPTLRQIWLPAQLIEALLVLFVYIAWSREARAQRRAARLERRSGGLRLRGAITLGLILFIETSALAMPEVLSRWSGIPYVLAGVLLTSGSLLAALLILSARGPIGRHRRSAMLLTAATFVGLLAAWLYRGAAPALLFACAHVAVLLLLGRAVVPASGRRGGWTVSVGFLVLVAFTALYGTTYYYAFTLPWMHDRAIWVFALAAAVLALVLLVIPTPQRSAPALPRRPAFIAGAALALLSVTATAIAVAAGAAVYRPAPEREELRVATYNVHQGFDESWRFDPESVARTLERSGADIVGLQELAAGVPFLYGVDLPLWLARRLRMRAELAPSANQLMGDAILARVPIAAASHVVIRSRDSGEVEARSLGSVVTRSGRRVYNMRLDSDPEVQYNQIGMALAAVHAGPAVLLGDLKLDQSAYALAALGRAGFRDVFLLSGSAPEPTVPERHPVRRADWILVRGMDASRAEVLDTRGSDHRLVTATIFGR